jgi:hypothetical protein
MPLESIEMAVLYTSLPEEYRDLILIPLSFHRAQRSALFRAHHRLAGRLQRDALLADP